MDIILSAKQRIGLNEEDLARAILDRVRSAVRRRLRVKVFVAFPCTSYTKLQMPNGGTRRLGKEDGDRSKEYDAAKIAEEKAADEVTQATFDLLCEIAKISPDAEISFEVSRA